MSEENEVPPYEDLLASLADQVSHLAYGGDPDDTGQRQIPAAEVIAWAVNELKRLRDRKPTLTDAERESVHFMLRHAADHSPFPDSADYIAHHKAVSAMMERLK